MQSSIIINIKEDDNINNVNIHNMFKNYIDNNINIHIIGNFNRISKNYLEIEKINNNIDKKYSTCGHVIDV
jgi:hypothetical protein